MYKIGHHDRAGIIWVLGRVHCPMATSTIQVYVEVGHHSCLHIIGQEIEQCFG